MAQASAEKVEQTGPAEKERIAQSKYLARTAEPFLSIGKKNGTDYQIMRWERVKVSEIHNLARERGIRVGAWGGKGGLDSEESEFQEREGGQAKRSSLGEVGGGMSG